MRFRLLLALTLLVVATPCLAQKVYIDYDRTVKFDRFKTFAWYETDSTSLSDSSPLMHSRIKNEIESALADGGLTEVKSNPDLYVTYHTDEREELAINTTNHGYGYGTDWDWDPYWDWGPGWGSTTTTTTTYIKGTLIIDVWDANKQKMVWRATAEGIVPEKPEKEAKQIQKVVKKIGKKWDKMYQGR